MRGDQPGQDVVRRVADTHGPAVLDMQHVDARHAADRLQHLRLALLGVGLQLPLAIGALQPRMAQAEQRQRGQGEAEPAGDRPDRYMVFIEERVDKMCNIWGGQEEVARIAETIAPERTGDEALLNGPALADDENVVSQDDIDSLFG